VAGLCGGRRIEIHLRSEYQYIVLAQFDEVNEGTAIFKVTAKTSNLPLPNGGWLALEAIGENPSNSYLFSNQSANVCKAKLKSNVKQHQQVSV